MIRLRIVKLRIMICKMVVIIRRAIDMMNKSSCRASFIYAQSCDPPNRSHCCIHRQLGRPSKSTTQDRAARIRKKEQNHSG